MTCPTCAGSGWYFRYQGDDPEMGHWSKRTECPCGAAERERLKVEKADLERLRTTLEMEFGHEHERRIRGA